MNPPITQSQRELLAKLVAQGRVTVEQLRQAQIGALGRPADYSNQMG